MKEFLRSCVERYTELAGNRGKKLQKVETPLVDEAQDPVFGTAEEPESEDSRGCLSDIASSPNESFVCCSLGSF